jgi:hypothetical protein
VGDELPRGKKSFLFNVDILIDGYNNGIALEALLHLLNSEKVKDYEVKKGIELGKIIEATIQENKNEAAEAAVTKKSASSEAPGGIAAELRKRARSQEEKKSAIPPDPQKKETAKQTEISPIIPMLETYKADNKLVRLSILKGKGVKLSVPCRIVNIDIDSQHVTVYHVDEKKVYQFHLNEIDDVSSS